MSKKRRNNPTYLVSGDANIIPADQIIKRTGRRVRYANEVNEHAGREIKQGQQYVVVAHGHANGTILWRYSADGPAVRWLWVGMSRPPGGARIHLYACMAGRRLPRALKKCDVLGHSNVVPMPTGDATPFVLKFFTRIDAVMSDNSLAPAARREILLAYVERELVKEIDARTSLLGATALLMLKESL